VGVEIWLVRHGETEWSLDGRHTSWTDIPLTEHGRKRAEELREFLRGVQFEAVLVSPRARARETCALAGLGEAAVVDDGLQEWNYGESEGKTTAEMRKVHGASWSVWTDPIVGGESVEQVGERADEVITRAVAAAREADPSATPQDDKPNLQSKERRVALFAHAHILRILAARWIGLPAVDGRLFALGTGSVSVLGFERKTRVVVKWNRGFEEDGE
jgi:broad specificity phosphatase PhoE